MKLAMIGAVATKMCPNNARCVVWAISEFFYLFFFFWMLTNVYIAYILWSTMYMIGRAAMMKTGPNGRV